MKLTLENTTNPDGSISIGYLLENEKGKYLLLRHKFTSDEVERHPHAIGVFRSQMRNNVTHFNRIHQITDEFFQGDTA